LERVWKSLNRVHNEHDRTPNNGSGPPLGIDYAFVESGHNHGSGVSGVNPSGLSRRVPESVKKENTLTLKDVKGSFGITGYTWNSKEFPTQFPGRILNTVHVCFDLLGTRNNIAGKFFLLVYQGEKKDYSKAYEDPNTIIWDWDKAPSCWSLWDLYPLAITWETFNICFGFKIYRSHEILPDGKVVEFKIEIIFH
jgi:hypothetical protein